MNRDDIFRLAQEAGMPKVYSFRSSATHWDFHPALEQFAALVAAAERERMIADGWRQCAEGQSTTQYCGLLEDAVKAEREACAKLCEEMARRHDDIRRAALEVVAEWIRARGESK
jgi:hypothetical protein